MSIRTVNNSGFSTSTGSTLLSSQTKCGIAFMLRLNGAITADWVGTFLERQYATPFSLAMYDKNVPGQYVRLNMTFKTSGGNASIQPTFHPGVTYHVAYIYDANNPSRCRFVVNGAATPMTGVGGTTGVGQRFTIGRPGATGYVSDVSMENLFICNGYAPSDADVARMIANDQTVYSDMKALATKSAHWTLQGVDGQIPVVGDPGISIADDPLLSFGAPSTGAGGGSINYGPRLSFATTTRFGPCYVTSSGRSVVVPVHNETEDADVPVTVTSLDLTKLPKFRINGGSPFTPKPQVQGAGGLYAGMLFMFPSGVKATASDVVTMDCEPMWFSTAYGAAPGGTNVAIENKVGKLTIPNPGTMRLGVNITRPGPTYYAPYWATRNRALSMSPSTVARRENGTLKMSRTGFLLAQGDKSAIDNTEQPLATGLWKVTWDDLKIADPTTVVLQDGGSSSSRIVEVTAYRNNGNADGRGKVRVFDVSNRRDSISLSAACSATDTTIYLNLTGVVGGLKVNATNDAFIEVGGETILIGEYDRAGGKITGCIRGYRGTATSHEAGETGVIGSASRATVVYADITSQSRGEINYENLTILPPGNWTIPETVGPASPEYAGPHELDSTFAENLSGGTGILRFMDSTPTMNPYSSATEPEHVRDINDKFWSADREVLDCEVSDFRPYDPAVSPYVYMRIASPGFSTYTATLGEAISTTPPAGTIETITITDAATAPVLYGSRLLHNDEVMRVVGGSGTQWQVERGAAGTTPVTHAAGPIDVGWRALLSPVPSSTSGFDFEIVTKEPHRYSTGTRLGGAMTISTVDANLMSRRTGVLVAAIDATVKTFAITPSVPGDWYYIAPKLNIVIDGETMTIESVNESAGTITVASRSGGVGHAAGAAFKTQAFDRVLCKSPDGTVRRWQRFKGADNMACFVTGPNTLRMQMPFFASDSKLESIVVPGQTFAPGTLTAPCNPPGFAFPDAFTAGISGRIPGCWHWLNLPCWATDDYVYKVARTVRDAFPAGRKVIVEVGNEIWNTQFPFWGIVWDISKVIGYPGSADWWILRCKAVHDIVVKVFNETGRGHEVVRAIPWQWGNIGTLLAACRRLNVPVESTGGAPYIEPSLSAEYVSVFNAADDDQACDQWVFYTAKSQEPGGALSKFTADANSIQTHLELTGVKVLHIAYEGGISYIAPTVDGVVNQATRNLDIKYNPNWFYAESDGYAAFSNGGKYDGFAIFNNTQGQYKSYMWGMSTNARQRPGYGDGRNGGKNNLLTLATPGQLHSKDKLTSLDENCDSIRWQAFINYNKAFFATTPGPGTDPDDTDPWPPKPGDPVVTQAQARPFPGRIRSSRSSKG